MLQRAGVLESLVFVYIYYFRCVFLLLGLFSDNTHTLRGSLCLSRNQWMIIFHVRVPRSVVSWRHRAGFRGVGKSNRDVFKKDPPQQWGVVHCSQWHITMSTHALMSLLLLNVIVSLLLFIIDEGTGDAADPFVLLKPTLSEAVFKLLLWNEYVPDLSFCCWDCFRTTLTHLRAFYKLDVEGDNRWKIDFRRPLSHILFVHIWCFRGLVY